MQSNHPLQVTPSSAFTKDLGLDSLDAVEVVMAIEEEFSIVRCRISQAGSVNE